MEPQLAQHALDLIAQLYQQEKHIRNAKLPADKALEYRQKNSEPIITQFFEWVYEQRQNPEYLPSNKLLKALNYAGERCDELKVFLTNPHLQIDTNHLERALRVIPMGRKNFLFCWTELGAEQLGVLQSLMVTCRLHNINPYHYLVDVLQRVAVHPAADVAELTPLQWKKKFAENFLTSDVAEMG
ncbi:transposase [Vibrio sp. Y42_MX_L11]|uniref:IS66 family transposase n=1 Tax=Vibrio sp. Y42_MX_L11 TaxID=2957765 RepID=UPI00346471E6